VDFEYKIISIEDIDLKDRSYVFSYPKRGELLKESIKSIGLLQPPILFLENEASKFKIICGEGRIIACYELNIYEFPVFITKNSSSKKLLLLSLESNLFRGLNLVEKAEFVKRALEIFSLEEVISIFLPKLNLHPSYHWIEYLKALNVLEEEFKKLIVEEALNPKIVEILAKLSFEERKEFLEIFEKLRLSFSEQKEVLEKLLDYKKRKDLPSLLPDILKEILKEQDFNKRKKEFLQTLKELYYPHYFPKLKKISSLIERFKEKQIYLTFSPYFEKKEFEIHFKSSSLEDIENKLTFLEKNKTELKKLLEEI